MADAIPRGLVDGPVYLDYNATTPVDPRVADVVIRYLTRDFGNPSSSHTYGQVARQVVNRARAQVAALIGAIEPGRADEATGDIVFTGSGSEANWLALRGALLASAGSRTHIITQATEHPAVLASCDALARYHGVHVTVLPVDVDGLLAPEALASALERPTSAETSAERTVVSVMAANNETGAVQPVAELAEIAHQHGALIHTDAAQAAGKIPVDVERLGVDMLTVVGHKMYAPKGVAALYVRDGLDLEPVLYGGGQERGLRAGTENVAFIAALGEAARLAAVDLASGAASRLQALRERLHRGLEQALPERVLLNGPTASRLPNTLNVSISGALGHRLLEQSPRIAASTGSACHSGIHTPSPVLTAMGVDDERALAAIRLSLGRWTTPRDIDVAIDVVSDAARGDRPAV